jgi:hypothetical protein
LISAVVTIAEAKAAGLQRGFNSFNNAARPATCGVAILVPDIIAHL